MSVKGLTQKQKIFVDKYIALKFNGYAAAVAAGFSEKTARSAAGRLINMTKIKNEISKRVDDLLSDTAKLTKEWLSEVRTAAMFDPREIVSFGKDTITVLDSTKIPDWAARMITEISQTKDKEGRSLLKLKFVSKEKAFELLGKYLAILSDNPPPPVDNKDSLDEKTIRERIAYLEMRRGKTDS